MSKTTKLGSLLKATAKLSDKKLAADIRMYVIDSINKIADQQYGILQYFDSNSNSYTTRDHQTVERGSDEGVGDGLYGVGVKEYDDSDMSIDHTSRSLSTRYSPDRVGVQARRIADGVFQDPITNKIYDWNEGFKTEDGDEISGGSVSLQSDLTN